MDANVWAEIVSVSGRLGGESRRAGEGADDSDCAGASAEGGTAVEHSQLQESRSDRWHHIESHIL